MSSSSSTAAGNFAAALEASGHYPLHARSLSTLQVNLGKLCNQVCKHCHVDAGPQRTGAHENMSGEGAALVLDVLEKGVFTTLDLTGGAPELNPNFIRLVKGAVQLGIKVIDRCNLSVLFEPGQDGLAQVLVEHRVEVVASLPFYTQS
ncbi:MAG: radical SAM protein, partial [Planctomycetes bacterium]|nr:radical SAM protein [Planctomycetota bacterium]